MALLKVICWALISIIRIRFPPGKSLATVQGASILTIYFVDGLYFVPPSGGGGCSFDFVSNLCPAPKGVFNILFKLLNKIPGGVPGVAPSEETMTSALMEIQIGTKKKSMTLPKYNLKCIS